MLRKCALCSWTGLSASAVLAESAEVELTQLRLACVHPQLTNYWKALSNELQLHQVFGQQ